MTGSRLEKLRNQLSTRGIEGILIAKPTNLAYLSGFVGTSGVLVITQERAVLLTDFRYVEQATAQAPEFEVMRVTGSMHLAIGEACSQLGMNQLGFEGDHLTVDERQMIDAQPGVQGMRSVTGLVEMIRMIKDETEIAHMRRAAAIADDAWLQILGLVKPGVSEREIAVELEYDMKKRGAEGISFDIIVASGVRSALPHGRASEKRIAQGDLVTLDFGALYQGYCSDMTRTVVVGEPDARQREIYNIVLEAQMRGLAACRPGMTGQELDDVCRSYITKKGYGDAFGHGTGHGVGRGIHEDPRISMRGTDDWLAPGNVITIEPGIYLPGWGGVRIEDMVLVTETGCDRLSQSEKELLVL